LLQFSDCVQRKLGNNCSHQTHSSGSEYAKNACVGTTAP